MIDVSEIIEDEDVAQDYILYRSVGSWVNGRWTEGTPTEIPARGTIIPAGSKDLLLLPEGDRITGAISIYNRGEIYQTHQEPYEGTSDKIYWRGDCWKVGAVEPFGDYGFWHAVAVRMAGN